MVVALIALVVAMSGTGYAAVKLSRNSVASSHIRAGAVTGSDIRDRTIRARDLARGLLGGGSAGPAGPAGSGGAAGPEGERGATGERGPEGPATGPAGGDLDGSYPAPTLRAGAVTATKIGSLPAVRVQQEDAQTIPAATTFTNLLFQEELYDTDGMFDPAQQDRITIRTAGVYSITGAVRWDPNATGARSVGIVPNNSNIAFLAADTRPAATTANQATRQNVSTVARLTPGTVVVLKASQDSGGPLDVDNFGSPQVHLSATWLAP